MKTIMLKTVTIIAAFVGCILFNTSCKKDVSVNPKANEIAPDSAPGNTLLTITGTDLQNVQSAVFDLGNVPVAFNPNFNTDKVKFLSAFLLMLNVGARNILYLLLASGYQFSLPLPRYVLAVPSITSTHFRRNGLQCSTCNTLW